MDLDRPEIDELDAWLAPFLTVMGRKTRRTWAPLYLRGLLGPSLDQRSDRANEPHDQALVT